MFGQHGNCLALHILLCHEGDMRCAQTLQYSWSRGGVEGGGGRKSVSHNKKYHIRRQYKPFPTPPVPRTKFPFPTVPNKLNYWHKSGKTRNYEIVSVLGNVWLCEVEMVSCQVFGGWVNILWPFAHNLLMPQPRKPTMKRMRHYYYSSPFFCFVRLSSY